jgi:hypothetical protein
MSRCVSDPAKGPQAAALHLFAEWLDKRENSSTHDEKSEKHLPFPTCHAHKSRRMTWRCNNHDCDSSYSDKESTPPPPSDDRSKHSSELSQEVIQENYREFERRCARKNAAHGCYAKENCIPGVDDGVAQVDNEFERIFLEDSEKEDWYSDIAGSEEMDGIEMDYC